MSKSTGRKGGTSFPRRNLKQLSKDLKLIVSKTSQKAMEQDDFCRGALKMEPTWRCDYKIAALRHFGLLDNKECKTTDLCADIAARPETEQKPYYKKAFMNCEVFKKTFDIFNGRAVKTTEIETYANRSLNVHLENTEEFAKIFKASAVFSEQGTATTDGISFVKIDTDATDTESFQTSDTEDIQDTPVQEVMPQHHSGGQLYSDESKIAIDIKIDSTMDPERLEEYLEKLRKYGLI